MINFSLIATRPVQKTNLKACYISKIYFYESVEFIFYILSKAGEQQCH